jgi:hypothetical protein
MVDCRLLFGKVKMELNDYFYYSEDSPSGLRRVGTNKVKLILKDMASKGET